MLTYRYLKKNSFGKYCMGCFNYLHNLNYKDEELVFLHGNRICDYCGNDHHLVSNIVKGKRYKALFGSKPVEG